MLRPDAGSKRRSAPVISVTNMNNTHLEPGVVHNFTCAPLLGGQLRHVL
jgi:hypothetical protein